MTKDAAMAVRFPQNSFELGKYLPFRMTVLSNRLTRRVARFYGERFKLSAPEWRTMAVLGQQGAMSANAVIGQTTMDKVRVSRAVAKLLKAELITREADPLDRRRAILDLTPAGRDIYRQVVPLVQTIEAEIIGELNGAERAVLNTALTKIEAYLAQSGDTEENESEIPDGEA
ncbi:MAG TPA: MarR family winged helix-turn-helix transcriptional regulator [Stellaceae bacterium]|nr:MarR family winged helix-turn-helix transcriptional regulator [Stellaceae bacterium]